MARVHIDTLLQQSQPYVAVLVFADGVDLGSAQVHLAAVVGVVYQAPVLRVVDAQSHAVVT